LQDAKVVATCRVEYDFARFGSAFGEYVDPPLVERIDDLEQAIPC